MLPIPTVAKKGPPTTSELQKSSTCSYYLPTVDSTVTGNSNDTNLP